MDAHQDSEFGKGEAHALAGLHDELLGTPVKDGKPTPGMYVVLHFEASCLLLDRLKLQTLPLSIILSIRWEKVNKSNAFPVFSMKLSL
jgi:hypothetical protein